MTPLRGPWGGESEVVVRAEHDALLALDRDDRVLGFGDRLEVRIEPGGLDLSRLGELPAFVEERDVFKRLGIHEASS